MLRYKDAIPEASVGRNAFRHFQKKPSIAISADLPVNNGALQCALRELNA